MIKLTESAIELFAIEQFEQLGYQYVYGPSIAPDAEKPGRDRWEQGAGWHERESSMSAHGVCARALANNHGGTPEHNAKMVSREGSLRGQEVLSGSDRSRKTIYFF